MEHIVGVRLFERNHHSVVLTNAGQMFLEDALHILEQVDHALLRMQQTQHGQVGRLDIGFVNNAMATETIISDMLAVYCQRFPAVEVCLSEMHPQEQFQALQKHQIQVGFVASFQNIPPEFDSEVLQRIPFVAVFASQHRFASQPAVALRSLVTELRCQKKELRTSKWRESHTFPERELFAHSCQKDKHESANNPHFCLTGDRAFQELRLKLVVMIEYT